MQFAAYEQFVLVIPLSLMPTPSQFVCVFTVQPKIQPKLPILENLICFNIHLFKYYLFKYFLFNFPFFLLLFFCKLYPDLVCVQEVITHFVYLLYRICNIFGHILTILNIYIFVYLCTYTNVERSPDQLLVHGCSSYVIYASHISL